MTLISRPIVDKGNRFFSRTPSAQHSWILDELGNWRQHTEKDEAGREMTPGVNPVNAYTSWESWIKNQNGDLGKVSRPLTYDEVGAFLWERPLKDESQGVVHYVHDGLGRLVQVVQRDPAGVETPLVRYGYDALGRLAWRKAGTNGEPVWMVYDGGNVVQEVVETSPGTNILKQEYFHAGGTLVATQRREEPTGVVRLLYLHQDRLGSLVMATEKLENGSVSKARHAAYDPYGRPVWLEAWGPNDLQNVIPYGYVGARWDDEAAPEEDTNQDGAADRQVLYLMGARGYDPELGRFLEQDPIGEAGGLNLYAYVGSSPTLFVDPSGLRPQMMGNSAQRGNMFQERRGGVRVTIDGVNRNDVLTGNQMFGLNYRMDGGGLSDPEALKAQKAAVMAQWKAKSKKSQGTTPTSGMAAAGENTTGATEASSPIWTPPTFAPPETGSTRGSSEAESPVWSPPEFNPPIGPEFDPESWNADDETRLNNNCYNYVTDTKTGTLAQPGEAHGYVFDRITCKNIDRGLRLDGSKPYTRDQGCPEGMHKGFLEIKEGLRIEGGGDYHFYRQDADGGWSSKFGKQKAGKEPWSDPSARVIRPGYKDCGFYCVPTGNARIN